MDRQPTLTGERLLLRPVTGDHFGPLYAVACDPQIWALHPAHDRWQEPVYRAYFDDGLASGGALVAIERDSGSVVGSSRFDRYDPANGGAVEIGWTFLARRLWGGAFNREMKRLMLTHAFQWVERVEFRVGEGNVISRRALEKIGAVLTDREEMILRAGVPQRHVIYEIDRAGFASGPLS